MKGTQKVTMISKKIYSDPCSRVKQYILNCSQLSKIVPIVWSVQMGLNLKEKNCGNTLLNNSLCLNKCCRGILLTLLSSYSICKNTWMMYILGYLSAEIFIGMASQRYVCENLTIGLGTIMKLAFCSRWGFFGQSILLKSGVCDLRSPRQALWIKISSFCLQIWMLNSQFLLQHHIYLYSIMLPNRTIKNQTSEP